MNVVDFVDRNFYSKVLFIKVENSERASVFLRF